MPVITYDSITNSSDLINYIQGSTNLYMYPDSNTTTISGPIWLPKIYGKDLTAFEIASSGKIAITINDIHSMDVSNSNYGAAANSNILTTMNTKSNYAMEFMTNNRQVKVVLDSYSNDLYMHADSNIYIDTTSKDIRFTVGKDLLLNTTSNVSISAQNGDLKMYGTNSNMYVNMLYANNTIDVYSSSNMTTYVAKDITTVASNNYTLVSECNVDISSTNASVLLSANLGNQYIKMLDTTSNIDVYSSSNMNVYVAKDIRTVASNNYTLISDCNVDISSTNASLLLSANLGNQYIKMLDTTSNIDVYSSSNMTVYVAKDITTVASNNYTLVSECNVDISSTNASVLLSANLGNQYIKMLDTTSNIDVYSSSNMTVYVAKDIKNVASNDYVITTDRNYTMNTTHGTSIQYSQCNMFMTSHDSNMYLRMTAPTDTITLYGLSNMTLNTSNDLSMYARTNIYQYTSNITAMCYDTMVTTACNDILMTACNNIHIESKDTIDIIGETVNIVTRSDISYTALSNLNFYISSTPDNPQDAIFQISGGVVKVRGDLVITGSVNTSNIINTTVVQENLKVTDKIILLANVGDGSSNDTLPFDGVATNDQSGVEIDGFPNGVNSNEYDMHKKFLKWNYGTNGTVDLGTSNLTTESFWDLQGGSLRITKKKNYGTTSTPNIKELSFGFRINESDELEFFKKFWNSGTSQYVYKRLTKFGRIL